MSKSVPSGGTGRKASGRNVSGPNGKPKFYDGPTVAAKATEVKEKTQAIAKDVAVDVKRTTRRATAAARRHPWSIISILSTIPFLLSISLLSTVICPPASADPSFLSRSFLTPLGLHKQPSSLHQTLCYPANVYHRDVLQPYVYPVLDDLQTRATAHPVYTSRIEPAARTVQRTAERVWEKPVKPVVNRISRGARKTYLTYVEPHIPGLKARFYTLTAPYTSRISALYNTYLRPHLETAYKYGQSAGESSVRTYQSVAGHPLTGHAGRYANDGYVFGRRKSVEGYTWARPHAVRAGKEGRRITKDVVIPRAKQGILWTDAQITRGRKIVQSFVAQQYSTHLDPILGPHVRKAQAFLEPYTSAFYSKIYVPYIFPVLEKILPAPLLAEAPPKSFWTMIAEFLPSLEGGHSAERRGKMDNGYDKVAKEKARATEGVAAAMSKISKATESIKSAATASPSPTPEKKFDRAEMDRVRESLAKRVEERGQAGLKGLKAQLLAHYRAILSDGDKFPLLASNARDEVVRDIDYILTGLDKLYTQSTTLTREQVDASSSKSESRIAKKVRDAKERGEKMKVKWSDQGKPFVREATESTRAVLGAEWENLKANMVWIDDISPKDWTKYNTLKKSVDAWDEKYAALHRGETKDKALGAKDANINLAVSELTTDLDDKLAGFKERLAILKKTALERISAREALASDASSSSKTQTQSESRVSILPIDEETARTAGVAGDVIGKGKQQVMEALSMAEAAASTASVQAADRVAQGTEKVQSIVSDASRAVNGNPSPTGAAEHLESIASDVKQGYASVVSNVGDAAHTATRSAKKAVGVSASPANVKEQLEDLSSAASSIATEAGSSASSVTSIAAESLVSIQSALAAQATDLSARIKAALLDLAPTPTREPLLSSASAYLASLSSARSTDLDSIISRGSDVLASIQDEAHSATRAASRAVGASPTPESAGEYVEVARVAVVDAAREASKSVESRASVVAEGVKEATESVKRAVGKDEL